MDVSKRIKFLREKRGLTLEQVGDYVGVSKTTVQRWETGGIQNMKRDKIAALARVLNTSPDYLMGWSDSATVSYENVIPIPSTRKVKLIGTIACGDPILAVENQGDEVDMPEHIRADFALLCKGDSMINARIHDGDIAYIREQPSVDNGQIAAVAIDDEVTLKRVYLSQDHITLVAENAKYQPLVYAGEDMNSVRILGLAIAFTSIIE